MIYLAGEILIPVGFFLFSLFFFRIIYFIPLVISISAIQNSQNVSGEIDISYGPVSITVKGYQLTKGEIHVFHKPVYRFGFPGSDHPNPEDKDVSGEDTGSRVIKWIPYIIRCIRLCIRYIRIENIYCRAEIGFGDPFTTGILYGYLQAVTGLIPFHHDISLIPDFEKTVLVGEVRFTCLIVTPYSLIINICRLLVPEILKPMGCINRDGIVANVRKYPH
jgi:hypothetical protein